MVTVLMSDKKQENLSFFIFITRRNKRIPHVLSLYLYLTFHTLPPIFSSLTSIFSILYIINMGNCLRNSKISAQENQNHDTFSHEKVKALPILSKLEAPGMEQSMKKKVRFMVQNGEGENYCRSGSARIRVVMSVEELKRMLRCKDEAELQSSMEQLLHAVKFRGGRVSEVGGECDDERINSWKPSLDTIPEDCFMNLK
ncbi:hypothetical protein VNO80_25063 [Phaseolus coccineus]|uniref:Uncharacterized protein n=1 Tax=Phaseolus coccineus TaxID=3886 RepID=A0AAN9LTL4_PHACN